MSVMRNITGLAAALAVLLLAGCSHYTWRSQVPADMRTVSVPTFLNESDGTRQRGHAPGPARVSA